MAETNSLRGPHEDELTKIISLAEQTSITIEDPQSLLAAGYAPGQIISYLQEIVDGTRPIPKNFSPTQILEDPKKLKPVESIDDAVELLVKPESTIRPKTTKRGHIKDEESVPRVKRQTYPEVIEEYTSTAETPDYSKIAEPRQFLELSKNEPHKTNYVLDAVQFEIHEKNLLFLVYGKEIVKKANELYFGTPGNVHKEKALASGNPRNLQVGLVSTMESLRTKRDYRRTENTILNGADILEEMKSKYKDSEITHMKEKVILDIELHDVLNYLVGKYILGKELTPPKLALSSEFVTR